MNNQELIEWLLRGDVSIQYQVYRDLLDAERPDLRMRIATEGWGARFLSKRNTNGHWGKRFYEPKWTSTHYTLLDLRNLEISPDHPLIRETIDRILKEEKSPDGGIHPISMENKSDVCVNGMFLNYASYFRADQEQLKSIIDFLLAEQMDDGGFNCMSNRSGAIHSSMHSTLSVLEGLTEYELNGYYYRMHEIDEVRRAAIEFLLLHRLYLSDQTGKIINPDFIKLTYPCRWRYDILRALDYFRHADVLWDERMGPAVEVLWKKRNKNMTWNTQAKHPGQVHFDMEESGKPSRWNTLRALRVLKHFKIMEGELVEDLAIQN
ncbi:hypothetical protein [Ekhidna sp.]|uniref:hypothetical protein n=1 Tax=Ekhidna sp. TaxID=2608089 RepID=UPI003B591AEF